MALRLYGIKNCDTMKKARAWLDARGVRYEFHDYKTDGIERSRLERWCSTVGWEKLLNRSGTTFRRLPETVKTALDRAAALRLMLAQPSSIKRPVLEHDGRVIVGFDAEVYERQFPVREA